MNYDYILFQSFLFVRWVKCKQINKQEKSSVFYEILLNTHKAHTTTAADTEKNILTTISMIWSDLLFIYLFL